MKILWTFDSELEQDLYRYENCMKAEQMRRALTTLRDMLRDKVKYPAEGADPMKQEAYDEIYSKMFEIFNNSDERGGVWEL